MRNVRDLVAGVDTVRGAILNVTPGFLETFGIDLVRGRDFSEDRPADASGSVLVNESLVAAFGWEEPLGKRMDAMYGFTDAAVVGVVGDFHFESLHERIEPVAIFVGDEPLWSFYARIRPDNVHSAVAALEGAWRDVAPELPFEIEFVDQAVDQIYRSEMQWAWLIRAGAGIAIFIACLGLLGLTALAAARRRKEISIRQVLGASAEQIVVLLTGRFVVLVLVALAIATPLAYLAMRRWLDGFAYRIEVTPGVFLLAGAVAVGIAVLTVSTQAVRAALADPADALRSE
jgi:putative ABC transport system permease protein